MANSGPNSQVDQDLRTIQKLLTKAYTWPSTKGKSMTRDEYNQAHADIAMAEQCLKRLQRLLVARRERALGVQARNT